MTYVTSMRHPDADSPDFATFARWFMNSDRRGATEADLASFMAEREDIIHRIVAKRGFPYRVVAQFVDEQLRYLADMVEPFIPYTRTEYRELVKDRIAELLEIARLSGLGEDESRRMLAAAAQKVRTCETWGLRAA